MSKITIVSVNMRYVTYRDSSVFPAEALAVVKSTIIALGQRAGTTTRTLIPQSFSAWITLRSAILISSVAGSSLKTKAQWNYHGRERRDSLSPLKFKVCKIQHEGSHTQPLQPIRFMKPYSVVSNAAFNNVVV